MSVDNFFQEEFFADILRPVEPKKPMKQNRPTELLSSPSLAPAPAPAQPGSPTPEYRVVRSPRRKRSISAFRKNGLIEIHVPARTTRREEAELVPEMIAMVLARESKRRRTDEKLAQIAQELLAELLPEFEERPSSVTWRSMRDRWGSCTTVDRTIRISDRLNSVPEFVLRCVLFHELIHLRIPDHQAEFYAFLERFPDRERAEAFLDGYEAGLIAAPSEAN
ncbi:MAG: M48 family metallopeptidase [Actinomycetes bacterium]